MINITKLHRLRHFFDSVTKNVQKSSSANRTLTSSHLQDGVGLNL